jgi:hypothetical protein
MKDRGKESLGMTEYLRKKKKGKEGRKMQMQTEKKIEM